MQGIGVGSITQFHPELDSVGPKTGVLELKRRLGGAARNGRGKLIGIDRQINLLRGTSNVAQVQESISTEHPQPWS
jgi:hypothetical protein